MRSRFLGSASAQVRNACEGLDVGEHLPSRRSRLGCGLEGRGLAEFYGGCSIHPATTCTLGGRTSHAGVSPSSEIA